MMSTVFARRTRCCAATVLLVLAAASTTTLLAAAPKSHLFQAGAGSTDYTTRMTAAISDWNANLAAGADAQRAITTRFIAIATEHPEGWEAAIWAAHAITQIPPEGGESVMVHMDGAQEWLDESIRRAGDAPPAVVSEFHMMQSLLHSNRGAAVDDNAERSRLYGESRAAQALAEAANPDNPRAWMFRGFNLIRQNKTDEGRIMLTKALGKWDAYPPDNPLHPDWGRRWVDFWMGGIEKRERQELPGS